VGRLRFARRRGDPYRPAAKPGQAAEVVQQEILEYRPDVLLHVIAIADVPNAQHDVDLMRTIQQKLEKQNGVKTPVLMVLTKADTLGRRGQWHPDEHPDLRAKVAEHVKVMARYGTDGSAFRALVPGQEHRGCQMGGVSHFLSVIPVISPPDPAERQDGWNVEVLVDVIGGQLPYAAQLQYGQALRHHKLLRQLDGDLTVRFAGIAAGVASLPDFGVSDVFVLTPLQFLLIAIIGGLSGRPVSRETAAAYLTAAGVNLGGATLLRALTGLLKTVVPGGSLLNATVAGTGTYALGKSAEAFFFSGEERKPEEFAQDFRKSTQVSAETLSFGRSPSAWGGIPLKEQSCHGLRPTGREARDRNRSGLRRARWLTFVAGR
jgi:uncharacterized protein (DUF697 family)